MTMKNSEYWQGRFEQLEKASHNEAVKTYINVEKSIIQAQRDIEKQINSWYVRFANNNEISISEAKKLLNSEQLKEFQWDVQDYIKYGQENGLNQQWMKELENTSAKYHISRLEALKIETQQTLEVLFGNELDEVDKMASNAYTNNYYHSMFEMQKGFNVGFNIAKIDQNKLNKIVNKPWAVDEKNFSERIWGNKTTLINELHDQLTRMVITGKAPDETIKYMSKKFNTTKARAGNLIMTESAYFSSLAQKDCFNELDVEKYEIVATLDSRTSAICQEQDGKVYNMKDYQPSVTAPPFHNYCRSTTVPYFDDDFDIEGERAARDEDGKTYYVSDKMKYDDWYKKYVQNESNLNNSSKNGKIKKQNKILSLDECEQLIQQHGMTFVKEDLSKLDSELLSDNTQRLNELIEKYPKTKEFISSNGALFGAKSQSFIGKDTVACCSSGVDVKNIEIDLSKGYYSSVQNLLDVENKSISTNWSMPMATEYKKTYTITHEFGHFIENVLINEYNHNNYAEFLNMRTRCLSANSTTKSKQILRRWQEKIAEPIAQEIYEIAKKNNPNFKLYEHLSEYGKKNSFEFFAECFANMECGKPNELGKAMKEFLKNRGF